MTIRKATIYQQTVSEKEAKLSLLITPDLTDFDGHFPGFPILPGVTQIDWAIYYGKKLLNCPDQFKGMEVIKFQQPILPNSSIDLILKWDTEKQKLYFSYCSDSEGITKQHSSGRIKLSDR